MPKLLLSLTSGVVFCLTVFPIASPAPTTPPRIALTAAAAAVLGCPWLNPACHDGVHRG
jgi:hypothetical protein